MADFWNIIDQARMPAGPATPSASPEALKKVLAAASTEDVQEFIREFSRKLIALNQWNLWAAGYAICDGMGDDSFHYFRSWIIGKGRDCFEVALRDPSALIPFLDNRDLENELIEYVGLEVLESRGITEDPRDEDEGHADDEPTGDPFDEEDVADRFPTLAAFAAQSERSESSVPKAPKIGFFQSLWNRLRSRN